MNNTIFPYLPGQGPMQLPTSGLGLLAQQPGLLSQFTEAMPTFPTMPENNFDPSKALMGGALMDISRIILGEKPNNGPMQAYQMGRQMYDRDRAAKMQELLAKYQGDQANFQNTLGVGTLMATLAKDGSPSDIKLMKAYGLDPTKEADVKKFYEMSNVGKGTNVTLGQPGEGDDYNKAINTALGKADADFILGQGKILQGDELSKIAVLESLNSELGQSGFVGNLLDVGQNAYASMFPNSEYQLSSETPMRDLYRQVSNTFVLDEAARQTGALSDGDIILFRSVITNLDQSAEGRKFATSFMKATAQRRQDVAESFLAWADGRMADNKQPSQTAWLRSDEFKALKNQSLFDSNPELLVQIHAASTTTANKRKIIDMRIDQLEKQGITNESQIADIMRREGF